MVKEVKIPDYEPSARQTKFHTSPSFETLYGGAAGGGKTAAIVAEAITYSMEYPKARVYIFRKTIPELKQSIVPEIYKQAADYIERGGMKYNAQDRTFVFTNGSIIQLAYLENPQDMFRYQSAEIHLLCFDELTHFSQEEYEWVKSRVRGMTDAPKKVMCATNPGNIGHAWVKAYFIDIASPETIYVDPRSEKSRQFIPAKVTDHIDKGFQKEYTAVLNSMSNPDLRRALLEGDWDIFAGQAFTEWKRSTDDDKPWHVIEPFSIPKHWVRWFSYDYGYNSWAGGLWFTRDPSTERIFIYKEFYEHEMGASKQAEQILMRDQDEAVHLRLADPSIWKQRGDVETGENIAAIFQRAGLIFQPANNDRLAGKNVIHEMLATAADGLPKLQVFSNCVNFIRTVPALPIDQNRPEDIDCFVAGTMITTDKGNVPVEKIKDGDLVVTPIGERRAYIAHQPHKDKVLTIKLSNGKQLSGNIKHKVFVRGKGLISLRELQCNDILETWNTSQLVNTSKSLSMVLSLENTIINATLSQMDILSNPKGTPISIGRFGRSLMAMFLLAITFITKTIIRAIMILLTLSYKKKVDTPYFTTRVGLHQESCQTIIENGESQPREKKHYEPIWKSVVKEVWRGNYRALIVKNLLAQPQAPKSTVPKNAPQRSGTKTTPNNAQSVVKTLSTKTSIQDKPVHIVAVGNLEEKIVYPLRVEQAGLYYANGVLVTNTRAEDHLYDCARYGLINQRPGTIIEPKIDQNLVNQRAKYAGFR